jgi:uncharacterized protein (DUF58 family)
MKRRWILITILSLILVIAILGGFTLLWRFFVFLVALLLLGYLWSRLSTRKLDCRVEETPNLSQVGKLFEEKFTITNHSLIPSPLMEACEDTDLPGYRNELTLSLSSRSSFTWKTEVHCRRRGPYRIGAIKVKATDPLGLWPVEQFINKGQQIVIYPATVELPYFELSPEQQSVMGSKRWLASEVGPNASRVREYINGDSLRHIHWHTTAHTGNLMVSEFDPDRARSGYQDIWIVLDMHRSSQLGENDETTEEYGVTVAASLARKFLDAGKKVGLITTGDRSYLLSPRTGEEHLEHILHSLALIKATGEVPIDNLLDSRAEHFAAESIVIVIMPSANPGIAKSLRHVIDRHGKVTVILLDSFSFGGASTSDNNARNLSSSGFHVYIVRQGMEISRALDSRLYSSRFQYIRDKA